MAVATTSDTRTEQVLRAADEICHLVCTNCWSPGQPMMCGEPDNNDPIHFGCSHHECPMCVEVYEDHYC